MALQRGALPCHAEGHSQQQAMKSTVRRGERVQQSTILPSVFLSVT